LYQKYEARGEFVSELQIRDTNGDLTVPSTRANSGAKNAGQFASCVKKVTTAASRSGLVTSAQEEAIAACSGQAFGTQ